MSSKLGKFADLHIRLSFFLCFSHKMTAQQNQIYFGKNVILSHHLHMANFSSDGHRGVEDTLQFYQDQMPHGRQGTMQIDL